MIIKKLTDNFFITNGFRIYVEMTEDFNEEGRDVKIFYSDLYAAAKDGQTVNTARENFKEVLRVNGLMPYVKECYILDAAGKGLVTHSRSVRRIRNEYVTNPNWALYDLHRKFQSFSETLFERYMQHTEFHQIDNEIFVKKHLSTLIRELENLTHS